MKKEYPETMGVNEIWHHFETGGLVHLSTLDGDQPRVRAMALTAHEKKLWLVTRTADDKVEQIRKNPKVEFTFGVPGKERTGILRTTAQAIIVEDSSTREAVSNAIPWFTAYWESSRNPNYTLIQLALTRMLYDHNENSRKYTIEL